MRIQHNIMAMNAYRNYTGNTTALSKNLEKLSSGYRINRAGDDAAGLAISEKMRAQISGLEQAQSNAKSGINLVQTAEGSLTEVHSMLNRMVTLANQSANGTFDNETDRANLQKEVSQLTSEIDRIADSSNFNGIKLLDGSLGGGSTGGTATLNGQELTVTGLGEGISVKFVVAAGTSGGAANGTAAVTKSGDEYTVTLTGDYSGSATSANIKLTDIQDALANAGAKGAKIVVDGDSANKTVATGATAIAGSATTTATMKALSTASVSGTAATKDGYSIDFQSGALGLSSLVISAGGAESVTATGTAALTLETGKNYTAEEINTMLAQSGAKFTLNFSGRQSAADIVAGFDMGDTTKGAIKDGTGVTGNGTGLTLQIGDTADSYNQLTVSVGDMHAASLGIGGIDISTQDGASAAIEKLKTAINSVSSTRGTLGALQNRLDHTINNLGVMTENIQDAESTVRDVDVAKEMMAYTKNNILVQSAQAMLAQANQVPQGVLQLLQ